MRILFFSLFLIWRYHSFTRLAEMFMFLIGSTYFVVGSYPEGYVANGIANKENMSAHYSESSETNNNNNSSGGGNRNPLEVFNPMSLPDGSVMKGSSYKNTNIRNNYDKDEMESPGDVELRRSGKNNNNNVGKPIGWKTPTVGRPKHQRLSQQEDLDDEATV
jgi:hypothetical protein